MDNGLQVVMSPVQLAAVLSDKSVTGGETLSNRLLGGLELLMGSLELAGATALCMAPEPTTLTKAACVVIGTHSMDSINAAANRVLSGTDTRSATYRAAESLARQFGADDKTAWKIGLTVDIAVPLGFALAVGAARVAAVRMGRIQLTLHESATGAKPGGHTIEKHIGKSRDELLQRLELRPDLSGSSTFTNIDTAERAITNAIRANTSQIKMWGHYPQRPLAFDHHASSPIGSYIKKGSTEMVSTSKFRVVLEYKAYNGQPYYILTAYPTW
ncbi:hypothetical protein PMPD1_2560 [Paramixta manurensis]|uniref:Bacterial CdiA-CT RNAse A domain-containing protein n=1 Tax=Paramixta manurensis TaxID=2740817 RepID=A0A6M8UKV5_9GAMM|nr:hypothetical protein PMPD1_2560 [Erwiniaceae bacterium PD-1]